MLDGGLASSNSLDLVWVTLAVLARKVLLRISVSLLDVARNVEGVTWGLRDGETIVESNRGGYDADACNVLGPITRSPHVLAEKHTDKRSPHLVDGDSTFSSAVLVVAGCLGLDCGGKGVLETSSQAEHDKSTAKLSKTLHGEDSSHHGTTPLGGSELGCDDTRERVVTADTYLG